MSSLHLQKPYVVATLPRPVNTHTGRYVCAEVHGSEVGTRKRKRELAVGIDGEGVNLYDITTSKLITSYALPPQSAFTCPPSSTKTKKSRKTGLERRTYTSSIDSDSVARIFMFRDVTAPDGNTKSTSVKQEISAATNPVIYLDTLSAGSERDLLLVHRDGQVQCLNSTTLQPIWTSAATAISQNVGSNRVAYCQLIDAYSASLGLFDGRPDILATFPDTISATGYNPDLLVLIMNDNSSRNLQVYQLPRTAAESVGGTTRRSVQSILSIPLQSEDDIKYDLHVPTGTLYAMQTQRLCIYDLKSGLPKLTSEITFQDASTFLRLSDTSIITATADQLNIHNPRYNSIQASSEIAPATSGTKRKADQMSQNTSACQFVSYSKTQNTVFAIQNDELLAMQIEVRARRGVQPRSIGFLIDSVGHGEAAHVSEIDEQYRIKVIDMDAYAAAGDVNSFERVMAGVLDINRHHSGTNDVPDWVFPKTRGGYSDVHPSWVRYVLSKIFAWNHVQSALDDISGAGLVIVFYPHNCVRWLIETGNLDGANIESSLRKDLLLCGVDEIPAGQIVNALVDADPGMNALFSFVANTYNTASEIVHAIRVLMQSLELFTVEKPQLLLQNGNAETSSGSIEDDADNQLIRDAEAAANADLALAEFHLGDGSSVRGQALSTAIAKLHLCPSPAIVDALKTIFSSTELTALIYLLRFELARGSWTSRYLDLNQPEDETAEHQNSNIVLITDLLNNCIDAIGSGGWLSDEVMLASGDQYDSEELIKGLQLEVSAALQGIEEAAYLKGLTSEMIGYGKAIIARGQPAIIDRSIVPANTPAKSAVVDIVRARKDNKPILMPELTGNTAILPLGLKLPEKIHLAKIGAGGEVTKRTKRDIGRLKSKQVPPYSRERIII